MAFYLLASLSQELLADALMATGSKSVSRIFGIAQIFSEVNIEPTTFFRIVKYSLYHNLLNKPSFFFKYFYSTFAVDDNGKKVTERI
jgi:hypothetical protein